MVITRDRYSSFNLLKVHQQRDIRNQYLVKLEHVLGLTVTSNSALDCDSKTGIIAYPAGCTIVFLSPYREKQSHLLNDSRKSVTCLTYSPDGRYLATGEYGHQPSIRIWDLSDNSKCCEFSDHKCGINCLVFSPNQKYLVSVGSQHDMIINVWDWRSRIKIGANKVSTKIKAVAFCETGDYFVTVGNRHVKFWYIQHSKPSLNKDQPGLIGRAAILGEQQNNDFVDVVCGKGSFQDVTYVVTRSGVLCEFNGRRLLDRWVNVKTSYAFCITVGEEYLFIGCAESIVRCFNVSTLAFVTTLPRTHYLGVDVAKALNISHTAAHPKDARYPDTIAIVYDEIHKKLTCVYNDHSLYIWDIHDIRKVGKSNSYLYHCACIWGVETYPDVDDGVMPPGSFITCSSDDTVRFWNLEKNKSDFDSDYAYQPNIYSNELLKVIYIDRELQYIKDTDVGLNDKAETVSYDDRNGVRSMGISADGQELATGDRSGNIRVYGLKNVEEVCKIEAHDAEVLCLEYTPPILNSNKRLLLSASRDRLIHIFDASDYYKFVETLDDHSSSITAIKFVDLNGQLQLVSCSADKSIIFRRYQNNKNGYFVRDRLLAGKSTLYDMAIDCSQKYVLTACQDRHIRVYNVNNGKQCKNFKGSIGEEGSVIKVALDSSGRYLATSCTDKTLCIFDYYSGECMACICGHSELVTGLRFSNDCERLISASGDGCIFVWRLPRDMVVTMQTRMAQQRARYSSPKGALDNLEDQMNELSVEPSRTKQDVALDLTNDIRFNDGQLPLWVTKSTNDESSMITESNSRKMMPKGRWAQRLSPFAQDGILQLPSGRDSDGSKEDNSSVDSGTETSRPEDRHEKLIVPQKVYRRTIPSNITDLQDIHRTRQHTDDSSLGSFKNEDVESIEHDGDVEDYSEVESAENGSNNKVIYYEMVDDALSEFKVNAIDVNELRKSQRRMKAKALSKKNPALALNLDISSYSVSGSQESDDDEDEDAVSTPSADNSEKTNSLTVGSVDAFVQREKYLKGTFESLSGIEMDSKHSPEYQDKKSSISSQHLTYNSGSRNEKVIQATIQSRNDLEATRKRQELQSRLEDIRGKLECAGTYSSLKSSQSTMDLRRNDSYFVPASSRRNNVVSPVIHDYQGMHYGSAYAKNNNNNIRICVNDTTRSKKGAFGVHRPNVIFNANCAQNSRPYALNLPSNRRRSAYLSLPQSPAYGQGDEFVSMSTMDKKPKRHSCIFYVDFNDTKENDMEEDRYSSDSLDENEEFASLGTFQRRRCVSEHHLHSNGDKNQQSGAELKETNSFWNCNAADMNRSHSEENILNDDADSLHDNSDRHSSASFFLRKRKAFNSSESILTDESEYQFLFSNREVFRSTESVLTDISDSNLNSQSDDAMIEETTWLQVAGKPSVARTRSLQDPKELQKNVVVQKERPKNESFFIPVDESRKGLKSPEEAKELFLKKMNSRKKQAKQEKLVEHPIVTHKPPKPQRRSVSMYLPNSKNPRKNRIMKKVEEDMKRISSLKTAAMGHKLEVVDKYGTFTKSKTNLGKNLLKNNISQPRDKSNEKMDFRIWSKNAKNEALKRSATITKYDSKVNDSTLTRKDDKLFKNIQVDLTKGRRHSLPSIIPRSASDSELGSMRRSCSLSDLSSSGVFTSSSSQKKYSDKYPNKQKENLIYSSTPFNSPMSRSSSEVALMPPPNAHYRRNARNGGESNSLTQRMMRPTIASQNKTKNSSSKLNTNSGRRRSIASVSHALNDAHMDDSSSEDNKSDSRPKSTFSDKPFTRGSKFMERSCSERDLSTLSYGLSKKRSQYMNEAKSEAQLFNNQLADINNMPFSRDLLNAVVEQFKKTADNIIRMHDRIALENINDAEKKLLISSLRNTIGQVQNNLRHKFDSVSNSEADGSKINANDNLNSLPHNDNMVSMIQQYSDVLVSIVQQKFEKKPS